MDRSDRAIMDGFALIDTFLPVGGICYEAYLLNPLDVVSELIFSTRGYPS
jgi:hypothetical protein